jgi:hypothetical protein
MTTTSQFWWNLLAIAISPAIAVQVSEFLTRRRSARTRKVEIFRTLMVTRAERVSSEHVRALNSIDLEFTNPRGTDAEVRAAWKAYLSHLDKRDGLSIEAWAERGINLMVDLLRHMASALSYSIDETDLRRSIYRPVVHGEVEDEVVRLRKAALALFEGRNSLGIHNVEPPPPAVQQPRQG